MNQGRQPPVPCFHVPSIDEHFFGIQGQAVAEAPTRALVHSQGHSILPSSSIIQVIYHTLDHI